MDEKNFMGIGMKFPPQIDRTSGRFKTSSYEDKIKESIYLILQTNKGERLTLPHFGGNLSNYVFSGTDKTTLNLMANSIQRVLNKNEKRIKDINVRINEDKKEAGKLNIEITYLIEQTDVPGNLVFPFYLEGTEEENSK